ncbi:hypothetical protein N431DRAFT_447752 [Stipitochalara longipes BDJ]|nr:hypothetical protein N431DRAFT_447752 [Stipitochalara longipes BDJ]
MELTPAHMEERIPASITFNSITNDYLCYQQREGETKVTVSGSPSKVASEVEHILTQEPEDIKENTLVKANIATFPTELILRVFDMLAPPSATCLGLTCRQLYSCLKSRYPDPIDLGLAACGTPGCSRTYYFKTMMCQSCSCSDCDWGMPSTCGKYLWQLLDGWMGPAYKIGYMDFGVETILRFVGPAIFSNQRESHSWHILSPPFNLPLLAGPLGARYKDWQMASYTIDYVRSKSRLPNPFNKGDDWYSEAISAIKADIARWEDVRDWRFFWSRCEVFSFNQDVFGDFMEKVHLERMAEEMEEGLRLLCL